MGNEEADFEAELLAELMADGAGGEGRRIDNEYNVYDDAGGRMTGMKESFTTDL